MARKHIEWNRRRAAARRSRIAEAQNRAEIEVRELAPDPLPKVSGPKPSRMVDYRLPYLKKAGKFICEVCLYELKTEDGMVRHIQAKHPEVKL